MFVNEWTNEWLENDWLKWTQTEKPVNQSAIDFGGGYKFTNRPKILACSKILIPR